MPLSDFIGYLIWFVVGSVLLTDGLLLLLFLTKSRSDHQLPDTTKTHLPMVSVLVAARNEEATLSRCLTSLLAQEYPVERLEILVGNDASTDNTQVIADAFAEAYPNLRVYLIEHNLGTARGKANVLAQLAGHASGEMLLMTDADMWLPPTWCSSMVVAFTGSTGLVTGFTTVNNATLFGSLQAHDWTFAIGMIKVLTDMGQPVTSMGNNMAVLAEAYRRTGGYENMPFSITEDFQLTKAVVAEGYTVRQLITPPVAGITLPAGSWKALLQQRKRWTKGAVKLPMPIVLLLGLQAAYYPAAVMALFSFPWLLVLVGAKAILQAVFSTRVASVAGAPLKIAALLLFEFYSAILSLSTLLVAILPFGVKWKDRQY